MVTGHGEGARVTILESVPLVYVGIYSRFFHRRLENVTALQCITQ